MFLYKLTFDSGKIYIGQTRKTVDSRFHSHAKQAKRGSPLPIYAAWRKYGAPMVETLAEYDSISKLNAAEQGAILDFNCRVPFGYNLASGGDNPVAHDSTRAKLAARVFDVNWRANMSAGAKARVRKPWSAETRDKMSASGKAAWAVEKGDRRSKAISDAQLNRYKNMTPEQRQAFSDVRKRAWETRRRKAEGIEE